MSVGFVLFLFGAGDRGRTCMEIHRILSPARLPIPPRPHMPRVLGVISEKKSLLPKGEKCEKKEVQGITEIEEILQMSVARLAVIKPKER